MAEHSTLTGADLHEPKGIEVASIGTVYVSNGAGSGTWTDNTATIKDKNKVVLTTRFDDIGTASSCFVVCPIAGKVTNIAVVLHGAITVANSVVTAKLNGVLIGGISITVTFGGSGPGVVYTGTAASANSVAANGAIEIITDGGASSVAIATVTVTVDVS